MTESVFIPDFILDRARGGGGQGNLEISINFFPGMTF